MIRSFSDAATEDLYHGRQTSRVRRFPQTILTAALRKLDVLAAAHELVDLRMPPGNHLTAFQKLNHPLVVGKLAGVETSRDRVEGRSAAQKRLA